jgi:hypothetical protein
MPNSQIEMVVKDDSQPGGWRVCGEFKEDPGGQVDVYVLVRQGDVVARGGDVVTQKEWQFGMTPKGGQLVAGEDETAIASAVAIARKSSGLEVFTWAQRVPVKTTRIPGNEPPPLGDGTPAESPGTLAMGDSITSSLAVSEPTGPKAGADRLSYTADLRVH